MFLGCTSCHPLSFASIAQARSWSSFRSVGACQSRLLCFNRKDGGIMSPMCFSRAFMSMLIPSSGGGGGSFLLTGSVTVSGVGGI